MTELCAIAMKHGTDKGPNGWGYTKEYFRVLSSRREEPLTIFEVGVFRGDSLRTWRDFFPNAKVYGIDNESVYFHDVDDPRIRIFRGDAYDPSVIGPALDEIGEIDFFIDDCLHHLPEQTKLLEMVWPRIRMGGLYAIEETYATNIPAIQAAVATLGNVVRDEVIYARDNYSLTLVHKGPK